MMRQILPRLFSATALVALSSHTALAADWPAYRMNSARTATTPETLAFPLAPVWKYVPAHPPEPAWPDPHSGRYCGMNFDYAPQPVIAGGTVYFGSTTDDTLWALDGATGKTKWGFTAGGPVRFAPAIYEGRAYVASDDGHVYCLDAATGRHIWEFRGGLNDSRMIGNGRMISRWPIRSGVVVDGGVVYFAAGMWSSEGVYVFALDAGTGEEVWCNDTNISYMKKPHCGAYALAGNMPQGYMAASRDRLVFNNGFAGCWLYDRNTGEGLGHNRLGHKLGRDRRGNSALLAVNEDGSFFHGGATRNGWDAPIPVLRQHWAMAGDTLIKCEGSQVTAGSWKHEITGKAAGIAVGNGMLVVSSTDGSVCCFKSGGSGKEILVGPGATIAGGKKAPAGPAAGILSKLAVHRISKGYALVIGDKDASLAEALAANTELKVICALSDKTKVDAERRRLRETTGIYGAGVAVDHLETTSKLPYPSYFANAVVVVTTPAGLPEEELVRVQRPCGGLLIKDGNVTVRGKLPGAFDWDSEVTCDQRVKWPLELLWFGEPGPVLQGDKGFHAPVPADGRAFILGRTYLIGVDAYNGTELWRWKWSRPRAKDKQVSADDDYVYISEKRDTVTLDAQTGEPAKGAGRPMAPRLPVRSEEDEARYVGMRTHPLTGGQVSKGYVKAHGCGPRISSATMDFFRSATLGHYDFADDSGLRNFAGVRPSCSLSAIPALGLLIAREGQGARVEGNEWTCVCRYTYQTSLALVPVDRQRQEDWAIFSDPVPRATSGPLRHVAMNFGAPGDRRNSDKRLWLAAPRFPTASKHGYTSISLPYIPEFYEGPRTYLRNADRLTIAGTEKPWVYTSGYRGLRRLTFDLDYYDRKVQYLSVPCAAAPTIDGNLTDSCWNGAAEVFPARYFHRGTENRRGHYFTELYRERSSRTAEFAHLRHDKENLYLAYRRRAVVDRRGRSQQWKAKTKGKDAPVWEDDAFEVYVSGGGETTVHLGISCSGATYDAFVKERESRKAPPNEDSSFSGVWSAAARMQKDKIEFEMAIPWKTLEDLGMDRNRLKLYLEKKTDLSRYARRITLLDLSKQAQRLRLSARTRFPKPYTVRLHFAELENDRPGQRVFDVKVQDKVVLRDLDIFAAAGGKNRALTREFKRVMVADKLELALVSKVRQVTESTVPVISGMEIVAEEPGPLPPPVVGQRVGKHGRFMLQSEIDNLSDRERKKYGLDGGPDFSPGEDDGVAPKTKPERKPKEKKAREKKEKEPRENE